MGAERTAFECQPTFCQLGGEVEQEEVHGALNDPVLSYRGQHLVEGQVCSFFLLVKYLIITIVFSPCFSREVYFLVGCVA